MLSFELANYLDGNQDDQIACMNNECMNFSMIFQNAVQTLDEYYTQGCIIHG